jgi:hypothetical protein
MIQIRQPKLTEGSEIMGSVTSTIDYQSVENRSQPGVPTIAERVIQNQLLESGSFTMGAGAYPSKDGSYLGRLRPPRRRNGQRGRRSRKSRVDPDKSRIAQRPAHAEVAWQLNRRSF